MSVVLQTVDVDRVPFEEVDPRRVLAVFAVVDVEVGDDIGLFFIDIQMPEYDTFTPKLLFIN